MPEIELFGARSCPFSHRTRLVLSEKGIDCWDTEIELDDKPEWFHVISPMGTVPVIRHNDYFVWDSALINEYLEETFPHPALMPEAPAKRAVARFWISYANTKLAPAFQACVAADEPAEQARAAGWLRDAFLFMEREGLTKLSRGPYWLGTEPSLVDFAVYPFLERLPALAQYRPVSLPLMSIRLRYWIDAMRQRPSVIAAARPLEFHLEHFRVKRDADASTLVSLDAARASLTG
jgi:glutathione S-transferase